jgi:Type IX secretion system membrane protein PorP/SprF
LFKTIWRNKILQKDVKSRSPNGILRLFAKFYSIKTMLIQFLYGKIHNFCGVPKTVSKKMNYNHSKSMLKTTSFTIFLGFIGWAADAQVTSTVQMFQSSMAPIQATALPYNDLDKFEQTQEPLPNRRKLRAEQKPNVWYVNASTRAEIYPENGVSLKNTMTSSILTVDFVKQFDKMSYKIGGGVMNHDLQLVQLTSPFVDFSLGMPMSPKWQLLGGFGYRFSVPRMVSELGYQHTSDPKIDKITEMNQSIYHSIGMSVAAVQSQKWYIGVGVNRLLGTQPFTNAEKQNFTEFNLLCQAVVWKRYQSNFVRDLETGKKVDNPNRGFLSNVNLSIAARYLMGTQHLYTQVSCRTTLTNQIGMGIGWNTANRVQLQIGLMKLPLFKQDVEKEWYLWAGYDFPTRNTPYHGSEINLGYYF